MTNKEKALEMLNREVNGKSEWTGCITMNNANKAIELASEPDWYYPNKGEHPKNGEYIIIQTITGMIPDGEYYVFSAFQSAYRRISNREWIQEDKIIAYMLLPKYIK